MKTTRLFTYLALGAMLSGCGDGAPLAPPDDPMPSLELAMTGHPAGAPAGVGARVYRESQLCFLPGVAADGTLIPLDNVPCEVQLVLTNNSQGIARGLIKAVVPNESGQAVRITFGNPEPIPCFIELDGNPAVVWETEDYNLIISASGQTRLTCRFSDE